MNHELFKSSLTHSRVIAILRGVTPEHVVPVADALVEGGIRLLEVTLNTPDAIESIQTLSAHFMGNKNVMVGAGTVLDAESVDVAHVAGAAFILSPDAREDVIQRSRELGLVSVPGILTPGEALQAEAWGADYLKVFPVRSLGPSYMSDLSAVVSTPLIAVAGVNVGNVNDYLAVAAGVGIGSAVYTPEKLPADISQKTKAFMAAINV